MAVRTLRREEVEEDEDMAGAVADQLLLDPDNERASFAGDTPNFARMMKKVSSVRFASCEKLLYEYRSLRKVLLELVSDESFETFYPAKNDKERAERSEKFVNPIRDGDLAQRFVQVHSIMRSCRIYLRMFDCEASLVSEVYNATMELERTLDGLPIECFPEPRVRNHDELKEVFRNRKEGPLPGRKRVRIVLLSDLHIAAAMLDPYRCPHDVSPLKSSLRTHLENYLQGSETFEIELEKDEFIVEMMNQYDMVHSLWKAKGYIRDGSEQTSTAERRESKGQTSFRILHERSPISWWSAGSLKLPPEGCPREAAKQLVEFAIRTLSASPTATATERTFSHLTRIQPKQRSGLSRDKVEKLLFCQWNLRVLRKVSNPLEVDVNGSMKRQAHGMQILRAHRKNVSSLSYLSSLRSEQRGAEQQTPLEEPVTAQNVTAQNEPHFQSTNPQSLEDSLMDIAQNWKTPAPTDQPLQGQARSSVWLQDIFQAAVDVGYSMRERQSGGSNIAQHLVDEESEKEHRQPNIDGEEITNLDAQEIGDLGKRRRGYSHLPSKRLRK